MNASLARFVCRFASFVICATLVSAANPARAGTVQTVIGPWTSQTSDLRSDWKTFGNGPSHTGYWPEALAQCQFVPDWTATLSENLQQVAVGRGRVFVTPQQYFTQAWLTALDENTGAVLWNYAFNNCYSINPPTYDDGHVYVQRGNHSTDTQLWSFYAQSGVPYWVTPHSAQWEAYMAPTIAEGKVWVDGGYYGGMYGFQQSDGVQLFYQGMPQYDGWTPTYYAGKIYSWVAGFLTQHDPLSGQPLWVANLGWNWQGWTMGRTSAITNGRAYLVGNPNLYAVDLTTHRLSWSVAGNFNGTPAVANGVVYALSGGFVKAYDAWDGSYIGVFVGEANLLDQPIATDDLLMFSSPSHTYVYDQSSYQNLLTIPFGGHLSFANRRLYIATSTGAVRTYAVTGGGAPRANLVAEWQPWERSMNDAGTTVRGRLSISNTGTMDAPAFRVGVYLSDDVHLDATDTPLASTSFSSLLTGETQSATVEINWTPELSNHYVLAVADTADVVPETNENNVAPSDKIP
jgi:hypothetical protein